MTKKIVSFVLFALFLLPLTGFSGIFERYCFQEPNGTFYDLRGGRLGKKAYTLQVSNVFCSAQPLTGIATLAKVSTGYVVTMMVSRDAAAVCQSYVIAANVDAGLLSMSGNFDNLPRQFPPDGSFTATRVACPGPLSPVLTDRPAPAGPGTGSPNR